MKIRLSIVFFLTVVCSALCGQAHSSNFGPWSVDYRHPVINKAHHPDPPAVYLIHGQKPTHAPREKKPVQISDESSSFFVVFFKIWSGVLTRIDGPRCSHQPTCSAFTRRALSVHGLALGFWISLQRLTKGAESSSIRMLPVGTSPGRVFYIDELDDYEFWRPAYSPWSGWKK